MVLFQSCAAGIVGVYEKAETSGAMAGAFVGITMIIVGIVSIAARKTYGGNIAIIALCALGFIIGITGYGLFVDLIIWSLWLLINAVLAVVCLIKWKDPLPKRQVTDVKHSKPTWMK